MKHSLFISFLFLLTQCSYSQQRAKPLQFEFKGYKIGDVVDTLNYDKVANVYFPNYLDGWTMANSDKLPPEYEGLPIATWQLKRDSAIVLTLLNNKILKITVSFLSDEDKQSLSEMVTKKFGRTGVNKNYEEHHPFQSYITYWDLTTWETEDVIVQIGNGDMRLPKDTKPPKYLWNLVYTDLSAEKKMIEDYKKNR